MIANKLLNLVCSCKGYPEPDFFILKSFNGTNWSPYEGKSREFRTEFTFNQEVEVRTNLSSNFKCSGRNSAGISERMLTVYPGGKFKILYDINYVSFFSQKSLESVLSIESNKGCFLNSSSKTVLYEGESLTFGCYCNKFTGLKPQWRYDDSEFSETEYSIGSLIHIDNIEKNNTGTYVCKIEPNQVSLSMNLEVKTPVKPYIVTPIAENQGNIISDKKLILFCKINGKPHPSFQWFKDNVRLNGSDSSVLSLERGTKNLHGKYTCEASNFLGSITDKFHFKNINSKSFSVILILLTTVSLSVVLVGVVLYQIWKKTLHPKVSVYHFKILEL